MDVLSQGQAGVAASKLAADNYLVRERSAIT
jgi:hypothetical protein